MPANKPYPPCGNPLFLQWVDEWYQEARSRNAKLQFVYKKAFDVLAQTQQVFQTAKEAQQLRGIGPSLVTKLQARLDKHQRDMGQGSSASNTTSTATTPPSSMIEASQPGVTDSSLQTQALSRPPRPRRSTAEYVPRYRSGAFAILIALHFLTAHDHHQRQHLAQPVDATADTTWFSRREIIDIAQHFCDSSFDDSARGAQYSAWSGMKTLVDKELVYRLGMAAEYMLSERGMTLARQLLQVTQHRDTNFATILDEININIDGSYVDQPTAALVRRCHSDGPLPLESHISGQAGSTQPLRRALSHLGSAATPGSMVMTGMRPPRPCITVNNAAAAPISSPSSDALLSAETIDWEPIIHPPQSFDVWLVLDTREIRSKSDRDYIRVELEKRNVPVILRNLDLGDIMWVARPHSCNGPEEELFLGHIVERKRMDDLIASIKDGRYKEQKHRLRSCGAEHVTYLVEGNHADDERRIGPNVIQTVISETQVIHGFTVKRTSGMDATLQYLALMTEQLRKWFTGQILHQVPNSVIVRSTFAGLKARLKACHPDRTWCISYAAFCNIGRKSGDLTLSALFVRMLMSVKGMSAEKATHLAKRYPTPASFLEALAREPDHESRKRLLQDCGSAQLARRKIGPTLSTVIVNTWSSLDYDCTLPT
ncbi:Crossover junction endonuclease mus81 [Dimargaris xerosporica]|nr:Crossover junction endonuclease mus81 [Dimargaris xerosporica]